ncbi:MAG: hypothetical protein V4459_02310 [Pseudomonadota bacterium]
MIAAVLVLAMLTVRLAPETAAARWFMRYLVDEPLRLAARIERRHLILLGIMLFLMTVGGEVMVMLGSFDLTMLWALDMSMFVDAAIAAWTIATVARGQRIWSAIKGRVMRPLRPRARSIRTRAAQRKLPPANDDDRPAALALAA